MLNQQTIYYSNENNHTRRHETINRVSFHTRGMRAKPRKIVEMIIS